MYTLAFTLTAPAAFHLSWDVTFGVFFAVFLNDCRRSINTLPLPIKTNIIAPWTSGVFLLLASGNLDLPPATYIPMDVMLCSAADLMWRNWHFPPPYLIFSSFNTICLFLF
jgi:hypothetical protein